MKKSRSGGDRHTVPPQAEAAAKRREAGKGISCKDHRRPQDPGGLVRLIEHPGIIFPMLLFWLVFGPVLEEPGWRGYALDGFQQRLPALASGITIGFFWMIWHLPLFFIEGTWQSVHLGFGTLPFLYWAVSLLGESVLYVWIYNNTDSSILAAVFGASKLRCRKPQHRQS